MRQPVRTAARMWGLTRADGPWALPRVWQRRLNDCGPCCLELVARHHGFDVSPSRVRRLSGWRWSGSSLLGLVEAAEQLGFVTVCARIGPELLPELPVPSIVHVEGDHFVVVRGTGPRHIELADPTGGCLRVPLEAFLSQWRGVALLLWPATSGVTLPASATRA